MPDEIDERLAFAGAVRNLQHAFVAHDADPDVLARYTGEIAAMAAVLDQGERRDRLALMRAAAEAVIAALEDGEEMPFLGSIAQSGFEDRAVAGRANPGSIEFEFDQPSAPDGDIVARFVLHPAFEGAPGRAHGGIVAAAFDDVTGAVIGRLREPAFTGELTVRFQAPVPVETPLVIRTRLVGRERRKLFITAEMTDPDGLEVATCRATFVTVDPTRFAGSPDPR